VEPYHSQIHSRTSFGVGCSGTGERSVLICYAKQFKLQAICKEGSFGSCLLVKFDSLYHVIAGLWPLESTCTQGLLFLKLPFFFLKAILGMLYGMDST